MAPSLEQWIEELGLQQVNDPHIGKPVYRKPFGGQIKLTADFEAQISSSVREARDKRNLPRSKLAPPARSQRIRLLALRIERLPADGGSTDTSLRDPGRTSGRNHRACSTPSLGRNRKRSGSAARRGREVEDLRRGNLARRFQLDQSARRDWQKRPRR